MNDFKDFKAVIFRVGNEEFGVDVNQVISIERMQPVTVLPKAPSYVEGVINLRGKVILLIDLRKVFSTQEKLDDTNNVRILVISVNDKELGLIVDAATDVLDIPADSIEQKNLIHNGIDDSFILGISKLKDRLLILLDMEKMLNSTIDLEELARNEFMQNQFIHKVEQEAEA
ncbi:chemotaxis protein CheW [Bacillaceae bacterium]